MIPHALSGLHFVERFYSYPVADSTNEIARNLEKHPQNGLFVVQADRQTAGRGRRGNSYFSDSTGGLWVSLITPSTNISAHFLHNRALSLAIYETIKEYDRNAPLYIKWPNDIYWADKKICGILLETHKVYTDTLIIGFGLNVNLKQEDFPPELVQRASSLQIETGRPFPLSDLLRKIINQYHTQLSLDTENVHEHYVHCLYKKGSAVEIDGKAGFFESVEIDGRLRLKQSDHTILIHSGTLTFL